MALEFSTIGVKLKYKVESSAGTRPTSGYTEIPDITSVPEIAMTPNNLECTNLSDEYERFVPGVKRIGNNFQFGANLTANLESAWNGMCTAAASAWASGKSTWFEILVPNFKSFYFAGVPIELGTAAMNVDSVIGATLNVTPNQIEGWKSSST